MVTLEVCCSINFFFVRFVVRIVQQEPAFLIGVVLICGSYENFIQVRIKVFPRIRAIDELVPLQMSYGGKSIVNIKMLTIIATVKLKIKENFYRKDEENKYNTSL